MIQVLLASLWQGAFVFAIAAGVTAFVPHRNATTRYAIWFASLLALVILPLATHFSSGTPTATVLISVSRTTSAVSKLTEEASSAGGLWIAWLWAAGFVVCAARLASYVRLRRILHSATPDLQIGQGFFVSPLVSVPIAAGLRRPIVIVPDDLARALSPADLRAIVLHERAHIARNDIVGNVIQRAIESLLFFNPWVYLIGHQLLKEREAACDDWAVDAGSSPNDFAACLATLALRAPRTMPSILIPSAVWPERILVGRIERLLNGKAIQMKTNYLAVGAATTLFVVFGFVFQNPSALGADANCTSPATILNAVMPSIPASVAKEHPTGEVKLAVTVDVHGHPSAVSIVEASKNLPAGVVQAVVHAAQTSTYKPEMQNCMAVAGGTYIFRANMGP